MLDKILEQEFELPEVLVKHLNKVLNLKKDLPEQGQEKICLRVVNYYLPVEGLNLPEMDLNYLKVNLSY